MKKFNLILLLMLPIMAFSQSSYLDEIFDKYSGKEGYTSVYITEYMFELFAEINNDDEMKEFQDVTSDLESIKILTTSSTASQNQVHALKNDVINSLPKSVYKDLMIIKEDKQDISFKIRKAEGKIIELLMIAQEETGTVLIYLTGNINLKKISKLSKSMNVNGFKYLNKINK